MKSTDQNYRIKLNFILRKNGSIIFKDSQTLKNCRGLQKSGYFTEPLVERPEVGNHLNDLKEDLSGLIQTLSSKLSADKSESEIESVIEDEVIFKNTIP